MTETATSLQALQVSILDNIWTELANHSYDYSAEVIVQLNANYDATVSALLKILGEDANVGSIDAGLASTYSDLYKDRVGFRPRGSSYKEAKSFVDNCKDSDLDHDEAEGDLIPYSQEDDAEWLAEAQERLQHKEDYHLLDWQYQAGRLSNVSESHILEY